MLEKLTLKNFTTFEDLKIKFTPGINVIIGENATGKTHLLKTGYAVSCLQSNAAIEHHDAEGLVKSLISLFRPQNSNLGQLCRFGTNDEASIHGTFATGSTIYASFGAKSRTRFKKFEHNVAPVRETLPPIFVPSKEVLSFVDGITSSESDPATLTRLFDATYFDIATSLKKPSEDNLAKLSLDPRVGALLPAITDLLRGMYKFTDDGLIFQSGSYVERRVSDQNKLGDMHEVLFKRSKSGDLAGSMTAEGFRKIGIIQQLLTNECLVPGMSGPLFWDEPEANMNPQLIRFLINSFLNLARNGQQIIIATHNYVLLKWLDLLCDESQGDHVRYFSLHREATDDPVQLEVSDGYVQLTKNPIGDTYTELYDFQIDKAFDNRG